MAELVDEGQSVPGWDAVPSSAVAAAGAEQDATEAELPPEESEGEAAALRGYGPGPGAAPAGSALYEGGREVLAEDGYRPLGGAEAVEVVREEAAAGVRLLCCGCCCCCGCWCCCCGWGTRARRAAPPRLDLLPTSRRPDSPLSQSSRCKLSACGAEHLRAGCPRCMRWATATVCCAALPAGAQVPPPQTAAGSGGEGPADVPAVTLAPAADSRGGGPAGTAQLAPSPGAGTL